MQDWRSHLRGQENEIEVATRDFPWVSTLRWSCSPFGSLLLNIAEPSALRCLCMGLHVIVREIISQAYDAAKIPVLLPHNFCLDKGDDYDKVR